MNNLHTPTLWQASPDAGKSWRSIAPTKSEPTPELRAAYLRTVKRADGTPAYLFRVLYVGTPSVIAAPKLLLALQRLVDRYKFDGIPSASLPVWLEAHAAIAVATGEMK